MKDHPTKKRHDSLQPFSRDHHTGLVVAQRIKSSIKKGSQEKQLAIQNFKHAWNTGIDSHFNEEERLLLSFMNSEDKERMKNDHEKVREYARLVFENENTFLTESQLSNLAITLKEHIQWEERYLFPLLEQSLNSDQLKQIETETVIMEQSRPRSSK